MVYFHLFAGWTRLRGNKDGINYAYTRSLMRCVRLHCIKDCIKDCTCIQPASIDLLTRMPSYIKCLSLMMRYRLYTWFIQVMMVNELTSVGCIRFLSFYASSLTCKALAIFEHTYKLERVSVNWMCLQLRLKIDHRLRHLDMCICNNDLTLRLISCRSKQQSIAMDNKLWALSVPRCLLKMVMSFHNHLNQAMCPLCQPLFKTSRFTQQAMAISIPIISISLIGSRSSTLMRRLSMEMATFWI